MDKELLKNRIIEQRKKRDWSQTEFAKRMSVGRSTVAMWETGDRVPDTTTIHRLSEIFDVSSDYLLGLTDDTSPKDKSIDDELNDPELGLWFKELKDAPEEKREELRQIWDIIKQREAGRKPGDKQKK